MPAPLAGGVQIKHWQAGRPPSCDGRSYSGNAVTCTATRFSSRHFKHGNNPNCTSGGTGTALTGINIDIIDNQTRPYPCRIGEWWWYFPILAPMGLAVFLLILSCSNNFIHLALPRDWPVIRVIIEFSVSFTDLSGVPTTGSLVPRVLQKIPVRTFSSPGVLASGSATSGVWNFTINS